MPVTTVSAATHIAPVVLKTFLEHRKRRAKRVKDGEETTDAKDDIFFDEAFHIVKAFIELGSENTVESLQAFTNTHVPALPWATVSPILIPLSSCNTAADILIDWFGSKELKDVVGGERWWQVRGLDGVDGEWITAKDYLRASQELTYNNNKLSSEDMNILRMDHLETVMLYVHGGGYFWGSINTHRYQIIRYVRKFNGRAFAVNYRKAPQYPWPCPIQDVLAAYMYLTQPPPGALHSAIPGSKIVMAGDSAGGGLCVAALTVLRDLGLPMPAGAVLISPWVDLTHSFPSIIDNQHSDIIPPHGFLAKPSTLWPLDLIPGEGGRINSANSNPPPVPGHADTLNPCDRKHVFEDSDKKGDHNNGGTRCQKEVQTQSEMLPKGKPSFKENDGSESKWSTTHVDVSVSRSEDGIDFWEPKPPKVLMENSDAVPLELRSQIQLYATTEQLTHPLVSPVLQGSLCNLPPLYILAGNDEVLRDEAIFFAHRATRPSDYPARHGLLRDGHRQKENAERFTTPTRVHLQVYDGMCHVLTVFPFTKSAKYAYRSIAEFVTHVSQHNAEDLAHNPFPTKLDQPDQPRTDTDARRRQETRTRRAMNSLFSQGGEVDQRPDLADNSHQKSGAIVSATEVPFSHALPESRCAGLSIDKSDNFSNSNAPMIRERIDIRGVSRSMEPCKEIKALQLLPQEIGIIKEAAVRRWLEGQNAWDLRFEYSAKKAMKRRHKMEAAAEKMLDNARLQGLVHGKPQIVEDTQARNLQQKMDRIQDERRWGPLDLDDERPPPSAIAKRRDTHEALALLKKNIYHAAPVTHRTVPKLRVAEAIRAALNPHDSPNKPPQQSASEQQVRARLIPVHGLRLWDDIIRYFGKKTLKKTAEGPSKVANLK